MKQEKINLTQTFKEFQNVKPYDTEKTSLIAFTAISLVLPIVLNFVFFILKGFVFKTNIEITQSFNL